MVHIVTNFSILHAEELCPKIADKCTLNLLYNVEEKELKIED
jgi:hypothetical protein